MATKTGTLEYNCKNKSCQRKVTIYTDNDRPVNKSLREMFDMKLCTNCLEEAAK